MRLEFGFLLLAMFSILINCVSFSVSTSVHSTCRLISLNKVSREYQMKFQQSFPVQLQQRGTPLGSARRSLQQLRRRWSFTHALLAANVLMFLLTMRQPALLQRLMKINFKISQGEWYRVLTSCFLHADISHILANGLSLSQLGPSVSSYTIMCRILSHSRNWLCEIGGVVIGQGEVSDCVPGLRCCRELVEFLPGDGTIRSWCIRLYLWLAGSVCCILFPPP